MKMQLSEVSPLLCSYSRTSLHLASLKGVRCRRMPKKKNPRLFSHAPLSTHVARRVRARETFTNQNIQYGEKHNLRQTTICEKKETLNTHVQTISFLLLLSFFYFFAAQFLHFFRLEILPPYYALVFGKHTELQSYIIVRCFRSNVHIHVDFFPKVQHRHRYQIIEYIIF